MSFKLAGPQIPQLQNRNYDGPFLKDYTVVKMQGKLERERSIREGGERENP